MKRWSLNAKVSSIILTLTVGSVVIAVTGLVKMSEINDKIQEVTEVTAERISQDYAISSLFLVQLVNERNLTVNTSEEGIRNNLGFLKQRHEEVLAAFEKRKKIASENGVKFILNLSDVYNKWHVASLKVQAAVMDRNFEEARSVLVNEGRPLRVQFQSLIEQSITENQEEMQQKKAEAATAYAEAIKMTVAATGISLVLGLFLAVYTMRNLNRSIKGVIQSLTANSTEVTSASQQIASSSEELSHASSEQAASLEETVATLEELTSMVKNNTANAKQAATLSDETRNVAMRGEKEIRDLMGSMKEISSDSKKIEEIISVIDDIAFQTNLLALNAAVEAARAGEQGKGFAVVAEAVRTLAQRSSEAAKDITGLIQRSVEKIEHGSQQAMRSGDVLEEIVNSVKKVADLNSEISLASEEQNSGISQISVAMNQLDQVTQINASSSEEAAASAQELAAQSNQLTNVVEALILTIDGDSAVTESSEKDKVAHRVIPFETPKSKGASENKMARRQPSVGDVSGF